MGLRPSNRALGHCPSQEIPIGIAMKSPRQTKELRRIVRAALGRRADGMTSDEFDIAVATFYKMGRAAAVVRSGTASDLVRSIGAARELLRA